MKRPTRRGPRIRERATIAGRARKAAVCARAEWQALAARLGFEAAPSTVDADALRREKIARIAHEFACGTYQVDAQAVAASLIDRLLRQARSSQC
jgi:anti-sigma28 factor (negative regulator of flagellin synthesis)